MELLYFIWDQFKVPILGLTVFILLAWLRVVVRPVRRESPEEMEQREKVNDGGEV